MHSTRGCDREETKLPWPARTTTQPLPVPFLPDVDEFLPPFFPAFTVVISRGRAIKARGRSISLRCRCALQAKEHSYTAAWMSGERKYRRFGGYYISLPSNRTPVCRRAGCLSYLARRNLFADFGQTDSRRSSRACVLRNGMAVEIFGMSANLAKITGNTE